MAVDTFSTAHAVEEAAEAQDAYNLSRDFYDAYKKYALLVQLANAPCEQQDLDVLTAQLKTIAHHVMQLKLFSPNEALDDISTTDLKYMLVPFLLGEVAAASRDMERRGTRLQEALVYWRAFVADCNRLSIGHADDHAVFLHDQEHASHDAAARRDQKIARHKRCQELDAKVNYLFAKKRECSGDEYFWGAGSAFDEEMERNLIMLLLRRAIASVPDNVASAEQELPLLEMMVARGGPGQEARKSTRSIRKPACVRIQDKAELQRLYREMVFQCPHPLATMSIEEAADLEIQEMQELEAARARRQLEERAREADRWWDGDRYGTQEDWEETQKLYKDRDFDEFKDDHPWGSGNKMANIG
ncbi:unnamed protein product [Symbiodinium pilosum]|uniref:Immunoglobulin-binding protein 1 n=1 Tax=Symbiodinium pilosum TaxID=2952 RepID=A0A812VPN6_SYMPI|nr:unnamed protein product [Symbiodinium pilosum]